MGDIRLAMTFFSLILLGFVSIYAIKGNHKYYWLSAIGIYLWSFLVLGVFGLGFLTVILSFVALTLAIGYSCGWIKSKLSTIIFLCSGLVIGVLSVFLLRDDLFYPLDFLFHSIF